MPTPNKTPTKNRITIHKIHLVVFRPARGPEAPLPRWLLRARSPGSVGARPTRARARHMQTYHKTKQIRAKQLTIFTKEVARGFLAPLPGCTPGRALTWARARPSLGARARARTNLNFEKSAKQSHSGTLQGLPSSAGTLGELKGHVDEAARARARPPRARAHTDRAPSPKLKSNHATRSPGAP